MEDLFNKMDVGFIKSGGDYQHKWL